MAYNGYVADLFFNACAIAMWAAFLWRVLDGPRFRVWVTVLLAALIGASRDAGLCEPETVVAMHISQTNNDYVLPKRALEGVLDEAGCEARVLCGYQSRLASVS